MCFIETAARPQRAAELRDAAIYFDMLYKGYQDALHRQGNGQEPGVQDAQTVIETVPCPLLRAARVTDALCRDEMGSGVCDPERELMQGVFFVLGEGRKGLCDKVLDTPLSSLAYTTIPLGQFTN